MKSWKLLTLFALTSLVALSSVAVYASLIGYRYYNLYLTSTGTMGDCTMSEQYYNVVLLAAGIADASPTPYTLAAGYTPDPYDWGNGDWDILTAPGWGPAAFYGNYWAVWGNVGYGDKSVTGITYYVWA